MLIPNVTFRGVSFTLVLLREFKNNFLIHSERLSPMRFMFSASEMEQLQIGPAAMLEDEISWLDNFEPTWTNELETSEADNILLAGHLRLIKTLLSLCGSEKEQFGQTLFR